MSGSEKARAKIAICEDERIVALDIQLFLQHSDYDVVGVFASAEELLKSIETLSPDLVLMDIHLQGRMNGLEAAAILAEQWSIPVIFLTAYADEPTIEKAKLTHPFAYILKPYDERELKTAIVIGLYRATMERRIRASEERYRGLFENGLVPAFLVDRRGRVLEANRAFQSLVPGASMISSVLVDETDIEALFSAMDSGEQFGPREIRLRTAEATGGWALFVAAPISPAIGSVVFQCQALDMTERRALLDQLIHAQKLSAMGRFAGGVAHDFNNVLTAIMGYANLLRIELREGSDVSAELDGIDQSAKRAAGLSRQLLVFSRRDDLEPEDFEVTEMTRNMEKMLLRLFGDTIALVVRPGASMMVIRADRTRVEQALMNLVANARDAMPGGGRIVISTGLWSISDEMPGNVDTIPAGDWIYIEVRDDGAGIPTEDLPKVFEPFFTTKPAELGTGLGLPLVANVMRQVGGHVLLTSIRGGGTTVRLLFPVPPDIPKPRAHTRGGKPSTRAEALPFPGRGERILLVEHDDSVRTIMEMLLERSGYKVDSAGHPGEGLLIAEQEGHRPDVLVADMTMPLMGGRELAERIRSANPQLPVVLLCSNESEKEREAGHLGARDHLLCKPFTEDGLMSVIAGTRLGK